MGVPCRCPNCNAKGIRYADGEYTARDPTFKCKKCGYEGGKNEKK